MNRVQMDLAFHPMSTGGAKEALTLPVDMGSHFLDS